MQVATVFYCFHEPQTGYNDVIYVYDDVIYVYDDVTQ